MLNIGELIKNTLKEQGRSQRWLTNKLKPHFPDIDEKKLSYKLRNDSLTGTELLYVSKYLDIDLNQLEAKIEA